MLKIVGGVVFAGGVFLFLGNVVGFFPTFPMVGYLTMLAGGGIYKFGQNQG
ncbi:MAG: hypothetical protein HY791_01075 [Deltaproteobacteria bacterium]|nr:hypothetical protein [Deltaproteobacteria bacterium]